MICFPLPCCRAWVRSLPAIATPTNIWSRASAVSRRKQELADMMQEAGFEQVSWRNLSGGIAAIHSGWRL